MNVFQVSSVYMSKTVTAFFKSGVPLSKRTSKRKCLFSLSVVSLILMEQPMLQRQQSYLRSLIVGAEWNIKQFLVNLMLLAKSLTKVTGQIISTKLCTPYSKVVNICKQNANQLYVGMPCKSTGTRLGIRVMMVT